MEQLNFGWFECESPTEPKVKFSPETETEIINLMAKYFIIVLKEKMSINSTLANDTETPEI